MVDLSMVFCKRLPGRVFILWFVLGLASQVGELAILQSKRTRELPSLQVNVPLEMAIVQLEFQRCFHHKRWHIFLYLEDARTW
jgi:hypothetical protein